MYIVVAGGGKVGTAVVSLLAKEGHDVVLIDTSPQIVEDAINNFDVTGVVGNAASYEIQKEAFVENAELMIAVSPLDELNILTCMVAKKIGCKHTIARVRNPEYVSELQFMRNELGLSMGVNPEFETAREISRTLRIPEAIKVDSFANGRADIIEVRIEEGCPLVSDTIGCISQKYKIKVLVCAVEREEKVFIPKGEFKLKALDKIYVTGSASHLSRFFRTFKLFKEKIKSVLIVGGGKISYYLAKQLNEMNMSVKIVERDEARCQFLSEALPGSVTVIHGDGTEEDVLLEEGLLSTDAFVAMTGMDEENIIISMYAMQKGVQKIVTKINRNYGGMLTEIGLDSTICPKSVAANHIVRYVRSMQNRAGSTVRTLYKLVGNIEALEFSIDEEADFLNKPLKELKLKENILIGCIIREGIPNIPDGNDVMKLGDSVIVVTASVLQNLSDILE